MVVKSNIFILLGIVCILGYLHLLNLVWKDHAFIRSSTYRIKILDKKINDIIETNNFGGKMEMRRSRISKICDLVGEIDGDKPWLFKGYKNQEFRVAHDIQSSNFLMDHKTKTLYCFVHKVGSTSLMDVYSHLDNDTNFLNDIKNGKKYLYEIANRMSPSYSELMDNLPHSYTFLLVRHPFERLLSAYRDRIVNNPCSHSSIHTTKAIFGERALDSKGCSVLIPTFKEFAQFIIRNPHHTNVDSHWKPIYSLCSPCLINYDGIYELKEMNELFSKTGIRNYLQGTLNLTNPTKGGPTSNHIEEYFANLECHIIKELEQIYKLDFLLFGYSIDVYMKMCIT